MRPSSQRLSRPGKRKKLSKREISLNRLETYKKEVVTDNHTVPLAELCSRLETNAKTGLTSLKAQQILEMTGPNALTPSSGESEIVKFIKTLTHGFSLLLWIGALMCFIAALIQYISGYLVDRDNLMLGVVLIVVVFLTGCFMYYQEHQSTKIMEMFANMVPTKATVIRDGNHTVISSKDLVVGDLVEVKFGDRIPADLRIIQSHGLKVDNSSITGENEPQLKNPDNSSENILESKNVAFFSTNAVEGTAKGIAIACGDQTVMGRIAGLTARLRPSKTPLARELERFMKVISIWACVLGVIFGIASLVKRYTVIETALFVIGLIVANVPEGLLATVTVSLTVTAKRMASKNCLVKNLEAVETLGSTSVICSDKTGTLTQNRMTVSHIWMNGKIHNADVTPEQHNVSSYKNLTDFKALMRCATLCNRAEFDAGQDNVPIHEKKVIGDASEEAILKFTEVTKAHGSPSVYKRKNPKLIEIPFSSTTKYQISVHGLDTGRCLVAMKGAPERILEKCSTILMGDNVQPFNEIKRQWCEKACMDLAERGERVLGFCDLLLEDRYTTTYPFSIDPPNFPMDSFRFVGFISLIDPPRPQVPDAVKKCRTAGIKVVMVTGDHPVTAKSIAKEVGIITNTDIVDLTTSKETAMIAVNHAVIVSGNRLREMNSKELDKILFHYKEIVFARTSPTQKLQIVEGCQRLGEIVTGDGVNDAPALRKADIGIAMGITGSEVSQQSADMILLDDNFASIIVGIEEGRKIFDNLKKSIAYTLASNIPEIIPCLVYLLLNIPLPLCVIAILCIDLLTDMLPAISLAYEAAESDIMSRPPRDPIKDRLVSFKLYFYAYGHTGMIETIAGFFVYFMVMAEHGFFPSKLIGIRTKWETKAINNLEDSYGQEWSYEERIRLQDIASSAFMISVVVTQWADVLICKTRRNSIIKQKLKNRILNISLLVETLVACLLVFIPGMDVIRFYPVRLRWWVYSLPFAIFMILFDEYRKWHIRKYPKGYWKTETYY